MESFPFVLESWTRSTLPLVGKTPDGRFEAGWKASGPRLLQLLKEGRRVLVHCRGGLGRAGTVSARMLVELGMAPAEAVLTVRQARPGAIETLQQERHVLGLAPSRDGQGR